jgi:hypothetical protein
MSKDISLRRFGVDTFLMYWKKLSDDSVEAANANKTREKRCVRIGQVELANRCI